MREKHTNESRVGRRPAKAGTPTKISSYYTPANRATSSRPKANLAGRWEQGNQSSRPRFRQFIKRLAVTFIVVFFSFHLLYLRHDPLIVVDREVSTGRLNVYEPAITSLLEGSVFNSSKLTLQSSNLEEQIKKEFPEVSRSVVSSSLVGKRPLVHIFQQDLPFTIESRGVAYIIAADGVIAGTAADFTGVEKTILIRDESGIEIKKGNRVLRSDDALFFTTTAKILNLWGRAVGQIRLTDVPREAYIQIKGLAYELRVYLDEPADNQMGTFFSAEKTLGERGEVPSLYMDLRAGEKVYWQ